MMLLSCRLTTVKQTRLARHLNQELMKKSLQEKSMSITCMPSARVS